MDEELRKSALMMAVDLHKTWLKLGDVDCRAELQLTDICHVAETFYQFLKGETK